MLYVLVPVLVHVLLDGSGHDSAEIDGTVERHATSAPTKQPVPAPRHSTRSSIKTDFHLDLGDTSYTPYSPKRKVKEQSKQLQERHSPEKSSPKSKIPVKVKKSMENERTMSQSLTSTESDLHKTVKLCNDQTNIIIDSFATQASDLAPNQVGKMHENVAEQSSREKEREETKEKSDTMKSEVPTEIQTTTTTTTTIVEPADLLASEMLGKVTDTVTRVKTVTITTRQEGEPDPIRPDVCIREGTNVIENSSMDLDDGTRTTISNIQKNLTGEVVPMETVVKTMTTVRCITTESFDTNETDRIVRTVTTSSEHEDLPMPVIKQLQDRGVLPIEIEQLTTKVIKSTTTEISEPWAHGSLAERSFINDEKAEQWESQLSQDTSPGSGNGDIYGKNSSSRNDLNSETDSDGSPQPRRRSPSKRCTLGSSSGSDVALHEGAELSPLEDDQGTALTANLLSKQCTYPANQVTRETLSDPRM